MPKLIKTRRSCIGCGMRPGQLYSNGLCDSCQHPNGKPDDEQSEAQIIARVTGSRSASVTRERRSPSGELVVESVDVFDRDMGSDTLSEG